MQLVNGKNYWENFTLVMDKRSIELSQLSRLLFNKTATIFYWGLALELLAGVVSVVSGFTQFEPRTSLVTAIVGFILLGISYWFRIKADGMYGDAETMRRQSVLSEALGWEISKVQFSEWKQKAGKKLLNHLKSTMRPEDYYETRSQPGYRKLLEMTQESAFYTRCLYAKLRELFGWMALCSFGLLFFILVILLPLQVVDQNKQLVIANVIYVLLPLVLTADFLGMYIKLGRSKEDICMVEKGLERASKNDPIDRTEVMRLVAEYNCHVVSGVPILNWLFNLWHNDIKDLWENR